MGKWNRRWVPRHKYRQQTPPSPRVHHYIRPNFREVWENRALSWEEKFCILAGVSWQQVVVAKRYMYCHENVVKWNDSAGEEAFYNAKKRFWAALNGLPCDAPLPDPDVYNDEIDWNPEIDPQLILDVDEEYFNPDEAEKVEKEETTNKKVHNPVAGRALRWDDENPGNSDGPWESSHVQGTGSSKEVAHGWNQWDNPMNVKNIDNPWEHAQSDGALKNNAWGGSGDKSWSWNPGTNFPMHLKNTKNSCGNLWDRGGISVESVKKKGWGDVGNNSCGWNHWETSFHESRHMDNGNNPWGPQPSGAPKDKQWRECGDSSWGWKQWENQCYEPKHLDSRRSTGDWRTLDGGCRKREGYLQHTSSYKKSRFQGDDAGIGNQWRKQRTQKRVSFVFE